MMWKSLALGIATLLLTAGTSLAGDTMLLGGLPADTMTLEGKGDADTVSVRGWRGGWGGGWRGGFVGWGGGWRGGWGGYRGFYRPGLAFYGPRFGGAYYGARFGRPWGYGGFWGGYSVSPLYYGGPVYYSAPYYQDFCPTSAIVETNPSITVLRVGPRVITLPSATEQLAPQGQPTAPRDGTYPYDGGPQNPVPMPRAEPAPTSRPLPTLPLNGRLVSISTKAPKYVYLGYGEKPGPAASPKPQIFRVNLEAARDMANR